ncbi:VCBS repeat-containing protein [Pararhizobium capsulatum DSM 1112]|uniref:VCBS repeat-containing protein n=1 Tax=Pararhizobium capsulatum DSM 1112 TaxID=1121113 RepID=A0ABU0BVT4_9HYPH|nr:N,N-dimethylformamidase beta subunit family domain-containing protein [Pararhizobium capsulatum]MDQ0322363.1 VCBS repeat-containing protein [Pararhizobium capsulatum DSM 1112]
MLLYDLFPFFDLLMLARLFDFPMRDFAKGHLMRDDRWWDFRSFLLGDSALKLLAIDTKARWRKATPKERQGRRAPVWSDDLRNEHGALADAAPGSPVAVTCANPGSSVVFPIASLTTNNFGTPESVHRYVAAGSKTTFATAELAGHVAISAVWRPSARADDRPWPAPKSESEMSAAMKPSRLSAGSASKSLSVSTDKADYAPGSTATFVVSKVAPGSSVAFGIADLASDPGVNGVADVYAPFSVRDGGVGDSDGLANGVVVAHWRVPSDGSATNAMLRLTATSGNQTASTTFSDASSEIVLENQKPGNPESEWGIVGAGSANIEGFATDISTNRGQTVNFKINTNSSNYRIDIYRLGYYGGMGARKVGTVQHTGVQSQPTALRDSATGLVDAGNWSVSASWAIPADAVSGIYIAKLVRQDGTSGENQIPFIVRDDSSHSDIIFQTSDETWQAYNPWGGANLYQGNGPGSDSAPGRAYAVSYNRPITTRGGGLAAGPQDYIFGVEYPALRWLEQNGYDVSYMAGMDSDRFGNLIQNHKMFLSVGHDEYWSGQQRTNVEAARDAGVNLSFWSGNEVYWETRFAPSISTGAQPYRTLVSYKETRAGPIDPNNQWTGTYRDPRFVSPTAVGGGRPENALSGTMFQVDSYRSDAINIPYDDANLRFWRDTAVANLLPGQTATLTRNYLGYEWDESPDNGFRPAGLIELSSTTLPVDEYLLDYGTKTGSATATHNLTLYRAPSGALVFGAGTVYWAWGLDSHHDLEATPVDPRVKQAMVNLLADMGIQPGTLETGLAPAIQSTDVTKPVSTITAPNNGAALRVGDAITISGTASDVGGVIAAVEVSTDGGTTWHWAVGDETWTYSWVAPRAGTFTIKTRAVDDSVNLETAGPGRTVTVTGNNFFSASATPPAVPDVDDKAIEVGMKFQSSTAGTVAGVRYYKSDLNIGPHTGSLWSSTGTRLATATFTNESGVGWQTVSFSTPVSITPGTTYVVSYHTNYGHYSATGNYFASAVTNGPLSAPTNAGVYAYNSASVFPNNTFNAENYWIDVLFNPASANTAPTAVADTSDATEKGGIANGSGGLPAIGNVLTNDTDPDAGDTKAVTAVSFGAVNGTLGTALAGAHGSLVLSASGAFTYTVNETDAAVQALLQSTSMLTDVFTYTMRDTVGATSSTTLTVSIHGANDGPVLAVQTGGQSAVIDTSFSLVLPAGTFTDVDAGDTLTYTATAADGSALPAWLTFDTTTRTFAGTPAAVNIGTQGVKVTATDLSGLAATETFNIVVTTTPNTAPTAVADTSDATEKGGIANGSGGLPAIGNVLTNDTDPNAGDTKAVTAVSFGAVNGTLGTALAGAHGSLVLNASGAFTYTVNETDAAVQALLQSTSMLTDVFTYTMRDTVGATSSTTLTVSIHGANDGPVLAVQTGGQSAVVGTSFSLVLPAGIFTDVDAGDALTYTATAADGSALPAWLTFDTTTRTFAGTPAAANIGTQGIKVTATDLGGLAATETFNIAVTVVQTQGVVSLNGTPTQYQTIAANILDVDGLLPGTTITYRWQQSGDNGNTWTDIAGATTSALTLQQDQVGKRARVVATYTDALGNAESVTSSSTNAVANVNDVGLASFAGAPVQGQALVANVADPDGLANVTITYRWQQLVGSTWSNISGATGPSWTLQAAQVGRQVRLRVTYTDQGTATESNRTSPATPLIIASNPAGNDSGVVSLSGTPTQNQTLAASVTDVDGVTPAAVSYRWQQSNGSSWSDIADATASALTLQQAQVGRQVRILATYTDSQGNIATVSSAPTSAIANANDVGVATITGTPVQGKTLTAAATDLDGLANVTMTYSWQQLIGTTWTNISGATGQAWTLQAAQLGRQVRVRVSYTDQLSGVESNRTSAPTPLVSPATNNQGVLSISGTPTQNQLLTALVTDPDGVPGSVSYQWQQSSNGTIWTNIGGATARTLPLQQAQVGSFVRATANYVDTLGSVENVSSPATPSAVANVNDGPVLAVQTGGQSAVIDTSFSLVLPAGTFTDVDAGDTLAYTATAADGSALPAWLTFDTTTRTFAGTPAAVNIGTQGVKVTATDLSGLAATETFNIVVTTTPNTAPTAVADTSDATEKGGIANGSGGLPAIGNVLTNDTDPNAGDTKAVTAVSFGAVNGTLGTALAGAHGSLVLNASGAFTYTVNETDAAVQALLQSTSMLTDVFTYTMRDTVGATSSTTLTVSIHGANDGPVLAVQTGGQSAVVGTSFSLVLPAGIFTDVDAGDTLTYTATAADGSALPAWLTFDTTTRTFAGTPAAANIGTQGIKVTATDLSGLAATETFNIAVTAAPTTVSLFSASSTPALTSLNDGSQLEVGMKFTSSVAGEVIALKFYRSASDTGSNVVNLWTSTGTNLANATFTNTAASGWQTVTLATPVAITGGTTYVASYHTTGAYVATDNFFTTPVTNGPLTAPSSATAGGNGVYAYGGTSAIGIFPDQTFASANYYADVVFRPQLVS